MSDDIPVVLAGPGGARTGRRVVRTGSRRLGHADRVGGLADTAGRGRLVWLRLCSDGAGINGSGLLVADLVQPGMGIGRGCRKLFHAERCCQIVDAKRMIGVAALGLPLVLGICMAPFFGKRAARAGRDGTGFWITFLIALSILVGIAAVLSIEGPPRSGGPPLQLVDYWNFFLLEFGLLVILPLPVTVFAWREGRMERDQ